MPEDKDNKEIKKVNKEIKKEIIKEEMKEDIENKQKEQMNNKKESKFKKILKGIGYVFKSILDVILNNKFVQILIFMVIFHFYGRTLLKDSKFGIFVNGTDNFINNYYGNQ